MKKLVLTSFFAVAVLALSVSNASAWHEFRFSAGFDIQYRGGGNRFLWGAWDSGPFPQGGNCGIGMCGQDAFLPGGPMGHGAPVMADPISPPGAPRPPAGAPKGAPPQGKPASAEYQPVGYANPAANPATNPYYLYQYYYGTGARYQVPSYWYGN